MYLMDLPEDIKEIRRLRYDYPRESISEENRNSDGFITLEFSKKKKESNRYPDMPPLVPQLRRRKLKKSWEKYFKSLIMKIVIPKYVKQFHNMKHECIYIKPDGNKITGIKKPRLSIGKLCERFDKFRRCYSTNSFWNEYLYKTVSSELPYAQYSFGGSFNLYLTSSI